MRYPHMLERISRAIIPAMLLVGLLPAAAGAQEKTEAVQRHPLELRALTDPEGVLRELPTLQQAATAAKDFKQLALLHLAESNACRVIANWPCQSDAAARARTAAESAKQPELQVRGLILESRGRMATQDFSRAASLLGDADRLLQQNPFPDLSADVFLAYSSLSYTLGKHAVAADYAERGLAALAGRPSLLIRVRLLRNQARAMAQLGNTTGARAVLKQALDLAATINDPKLGAELYLEDARIARLTGDVPVQLANGQRILALAGQLSNSQLKGLGHEVLGLAALNQGDSAGAERELQLAYGSFSALKLERDERRVLRALIRSMLGRNRPLAQIEALMKRSLALEASLEADDRNMAADDFEARLKYAQQELEVQRLEASAALAAQRTSALADQQRLTLVAAVLSLVVLAVVGMLLWLQRRFNSRLTQLVAQLRESESRYRMLAENSRDMVVRMKPDGQRLYVSPASQELLGLDPSAFSQPRWDLVHPDDRERMSSALRDLGQKGGSATVAYRARHANGEYIWLEVLARLVTNTENGDGPEIVYAARDITARVRAEEALTRSEARMRAITDNIPALITRLDKDMRYTFANAYVGRVFDIDPAAMVGRTMLEIHGEFIHQETLPHVEAALRGEAVSFDGVATVRDRTFHYQASYVPDRDSDGNVQGFYALTFDITKLKLAEAELDRMARSDSLTGVANRRYFEERLATALARSRRQSSALAVLCLDIDHFKTINDRYGHPFGDAVIVAFARSLQSCIREDDLVARLGGDEFVIMIEHATTGSAESVAAKLLAILQLPMVIEGTTLPVTGSIGIAYSVQGASARALMDHADQALYAAKAAGRNTCRTAPVGQLSAA